MAKIEHRVKDNPKLEQRVMSDGRTSLYLEYYRGRESVPVLDAEGNQEYYTEGKMAGRPKYKIRHSREKVSLDLYLVTNPRTVEDRAHNRETLRLAEAIRAERAQQFTQDRQGYRVRRDVDINLLDYFEAYVSDYTKKDKRVIVQAVKRFRAFLESSARYERYRNVLSPQNLTADLVRAFAEHLSATSRGDGAKSTYDRFKKVVKSAVDSELLAKNPCAGITISADPNAIKKDILSEDEVIQLIRTHYRFENPEIRRAFIFSLYTGVRFCDVVTMTYANVDVPNRLLSFEQDKTHGHSSNSRVVIPLSDWLLDLIGTRVKGAPDDFIFHLPSHNMCMKALEHWCKHAGIDKHITWHSARHSFAVNVLNNGANIKTVSSLLGHSSLKMTEKYTRAVDRLKAEAVNSLAVPDFDK